MEVSKRTKILDAFYEIVASVTPEDSSGWRRSEKSPITRVNPPECPAFYVFDFQEQIVGESAQHNELVQPQLYIILEFWTTLALREDASGKLNSMLWAIQKKLQGTKLGGLAQKVTEVGSKFKIDSQEQRIVSAEVAYRVTYIRNI